MKRLVMAAIMVAGFVLCPMMSSAEPIVLEDLNSYVEIDPTGGNGVFNWKVEGKDNLYQQWFWFRTGYGQTDYMREQPLNNLQLVGVQSAGSFANLRYRDALETFEVQVSYLLTGGTPNSQWSDLAETIRIINLGECDLDFHFFQYSDFDVGGDFWDDHAELVNANTVAQWDDVSMLSETVVTPAPNHWQIDYFNNILLALNDPYASTLTDGTSPLGVGDMTWAFQWDKVIGVGGSFIISKDKQIRPVPEVTSTMILLGLVSIGLGFLGRKIRP